MLVPAAARAVGQLDGNPRTSGPGFGVAMHPELTSIHREDIAQTRDHAAGRTLVADQHAFGRIPQIEGEISGVRHGDHRRTGTTPGVAMQGAAESPAGSGRAITRLPALARFAPRPLLLDLADQVSTHLREGMIKVALVGGGHEVRPSR